MSRFWCRLSADQRGGAAVEFALFAPLLFMVLAGIGVFAMEMDARNKARDAVNAGSLYVMHGGRSVDAIRDVTLAAWRGPTGALAVAVDQYCQCGVQVLACPATCQGDPAPRFTRIRANASVIASDSEQPRVYAAQNVVRTR
jgi:Flp pilus assembly protein TadG